MRKGFEVSKILHAYLWNVGNLQPLSPAPSVHLSINFEQYQIFSSSNLMRRVVVVGRYIRLLHSQILSFLRE